MADGESYEIRLKRLKMRSMRRGIKEMDIILSKFCDANLRQLDAEELNLYDKLLSENDQDLYSWVTGQTDCPEEFASILVRITSSFSAI